MAWAGEDLIRRLAEGDADACGRFYDRYARLVYPLIVRIVHDPANAADVLEDVFWEAWQAAPSYDPARGSPEAWLVTRARTRAVDRVRAVRRRGETFVAPRDEARAAALVASLLERLPEHQREAIELAYYGGLTQTEIAERLEQPPDTVKTRMRLGLSRLREMMGTT
jgi:RNA polymerase sigma-70 factor (ECF subfamily)